MGVGMGAFFRVHSLSLIAPGEGRNQVGHPPEGRGKCAPQNSANALPGNLAASCFLSPHSCSYVLPSVAPRIRRPRLNAVSRPLRREPILWVGQRLPRSWDQWEIYLFENITLWVALPCCALTEVFVPGSMVMYPVLVFPRMKGTRRLCQTTMPLRPGKVMGRFLPGAVVVTAAVVNPRTRGMWRSWQTSMSLRPERVTDPSRPGGMVVTAAQENPWTRVHGDCGQ